MGHLFSYQEKTGMSLESILKMPYIQFIISMVDAPQIDWDSANKKKEVYKPKTAQEQVSAFVNYFNN